MLNVVEYTTGSDEVQEESSKDSSLSTAAIVGISVGGFVVVVLVVALVAIVAIVAINKRNVTVHPALPESSFVIKAGK